MSNSFDDFISGGLDDVFPAMQEDCTVNGVASEAIFSAIEKTQEYEQHGRETVYKVEMTARKSDFPTEFDSSTIVIYAGFTWRVLPEFTDDTASRVYILINP